MEQQSATEISPFMQALSNEERLWLEKMERERYEEILALNASKTKAKACQAA